MNARTSEVAETAPSRSRIIALEGGVNFRDIGGYRAGEQSVRWGRVFRTGVLCYFTANDHAATRALGIRAVCDLRRLEEREREPTHWPHAEALSWEDGTSMPTIRAFAASRPKTGAGMRDAMLDLYCALPAWMAPRIRGLFECVATDRAPVVVHCAAGKDRTGVAIAALLSALGVPRTTIVEDYLLTNTVANFERFIELRKDSHLGLADAHQSLLSMSQEMRDVLFRADADYLEAALARIQKDYGDMENYLTSCVGVDASTLARVRERLLE